MSKFEIVEILNPNIPSIKFQILKSHLNWFDSFLLRHLKLANDSAADFKYFDVIDTLSESQKTFGQGTFYQNAEEKIGSAHCQYSDDENRFPAYGFNYTKKEEEKQEGSQNKP